MRLTRFAPLAALSLCLLAACMPGGLGASKASPFAPGAAEGEGIDGLIVGHRLMAAGEYELALKAYYRAAADKGATVDVLSAIGSADLKLGRLGRRNRSCAGPPKRTNASCPPGTIWASC